jgi:hypothetical protein
MLHRFLLQNEFSLSRLNHASAHGDLHSSHLYNRCFSMRCIGLLCRLKDEFPTWAPGYRRTLWVVVGAPRSCFCGQGGIRLHSHPGLTVGGKSL